MFVGAVKGAKSKDGQYTAIGNDSNVLQNQTQNIVNTRNSVVPYNRVKRIMKLDDSVEKVAPETPVLLAEATSMFIKDLTQRGWAQVEESIHAFDKNRKRNLRRNHIVKAAKQCSIFDFLIDIIPSEQAKKKDKTEPKRICCDLQLLQQHQQYMIKLGEQSFTQQVQMKRQNCMQPGTYEAQGNNSIANTQTGRPMQLIQTTPFLQANQETEFVQFNIPPKQLNYVDQFQHAQISSNRTVPMVSQQELVTPIQDPPPGLSNVIRDTTFKDISYDDLSIHEPTPESTSVICDTTTENTDLDDILNWLQERCS